MYRCKACVWRSCRAEIPECKYPDSASKQKWETESNVPEEEKPPRINWLEGITK